MYSQIPYVLPHTPRCETSASGLHGLVASLPNAPCGLCVEHVCMCVRTDDKTSAHLERVKEHSISNRLLWGALAHINMRFRQRNIPEAEADGPQERGLRSPVLRSSAPGGTDLSICSASSNVERRTSIRVPRIGSRLDDRRGPRHAKPKNQSSLTRSVFVCSRG